MTFSVCSKHPHTMASPSVSPRGFTGFTTTGAHGLQKPRAGDPQMSTCGARNTRVLMINHGKSDQKNMATRWCPSSYKLVYRYINLETSTQTQIFIDFRLSNNSKPTNQLHRGIFLRPNLGCSCLGLCLPYLPWGRAKDSNDH